MTRLASLSVAALTVGALTVAALALSACGKGAPSPTPPASPSASGAPAASAPAPAPSNDAAKPKRELEVVWDGGTFSGETLKVRVLPLMTREGKRTAIDLWAVDAKTQRWIRIAKAAPYGELTAPLTVPKLFSGARIFFFPPEQAPIDPYKATSASADVSWPSDSAVAAGPFTLLASNDKNGVRSQLVNDAELGQSTSERARVQFRLALANDLTLPSYELGLADGTCFAGDGILNEGVADVSPGKVELALFDTSSTTGCKGPRLVTSAPIELGPGDLAIGVLGGESASALVLTPVKVAHVAAPK